MCIATAAALLFLQTKELRAGLADGSIKPALAPRKCVNIGNDFYDITSSLRGTTQARTLCSYLRHSRFRVAASVAASGASIWARYAVLTTET